MPNQVLCRTASALQEGIGQTQLTHFRYFRRKIRAQANANKN